MTVARFNFKTNNGSWPSRIVSSKRRPNALFYLAAALALTWISESSPFNHITLKTRHSCIDQIKIYAFICIQTVI